MSVKCVERVLSVLEARVNVCRGESLRRLEFSFSVTYTQKEKPLDLSHSTNTPHTPSLVGGQESAEISRGNKFEPMSGDRCSRDVRLAGGEYPEKPPKG